MERKIELTTKNRKDGSKKVAARLLLAGASNSVGKAFTAITMADVTYQHVGKRGIDDYAERKHKKVIDGYSIKIANNVMFNVFLLADGSHEYENLHSDLLTLASNAVSQAGWLRGAVQNANGYAHTVKNYVETYRHFYGEMTEEQKAWMTTNLPSFEQAVAEAQARAKTKNQQDNDTKQ